VGPDPDAHEIRDFDRTLIRVRTGTASRRRFGNAERNGSMFCPGAFTLPVPLSFPLDA